MVRFFYGCSNKNFQREYEYICILQILNSIRDITENFIYDIVQDVGLISMHP